MEPLQLRKCPGGYKRDDVNQYIENLVKKYEAAVSAAEKDALAAQKENEALTRENAQLFTRVEKLEADRDSVSRAVISAQQQADAILAEARAEGAAIIDAKNREAQALEGELSALRREISALRRNAAAALRKYENQLSGLVPSQTEDEEEE